uniref:Uncharacterized protein n=1 Tax=Triticum urartu TaxID=4572 RepID=A0A8R7PGB5_TRIUA
QGRNRGETQPRKGIPFVFSSLRRRLSLETPESRDSRAPTASSPRAKAPDSLTDRHPLPPAPAPATLVSATPDSSSLRFRDPLGRRFEEGTPRRRRRRGRRRSRAREVECNVW